MNFDLQRFEKTKDALRTALQKTPAEFRKPLIEGLAELVQDVEKFHAYVQSLRQQQFEKSEIPTAPIVTCFHSRWWEILQGSQHKMKRAIKFSLSSFPTPESRTDRLKEIVDQVNQWAEKNDRSPVRFPYEIDL